QPRIDGRDTRTVRPLNIQTGVLPRTHGSALFTLKPNELDSRLRGNDGTLVT
ncbi:hypothetical protein HND83_10440, partial [Neisseria meningitidis]|nr:hypothetical protein [Neisseria meningitidis]